MSGYGDTLAAKMSSAAQLLILHGLNVRFQTTILYDTHTCGSDLESNEVVEGADVNVSDAASPGA